ncbi:hypothetical protein V5O48_009442 [Marasmius crinis-equi]|uniref:Uncharacterized protein n=1 Tax=Marasmius crinis-equi TaxID=585013 RepID=A0ABR3FB19_9AGAR
MSPGSSKFSRRYLRPSSILRHSQHFRGARHVAIGDHTNLSSVQGDQKIYVNTEGKKKRSIVGTEEEEAEFAEFHEITRGDIIAVQTVYCGVIEHYDNEQQKWVKWGEQTVITGKVVAGGMASKCTVVSYSGEGAEERWRSDFWQLSGARRADKAQLVAINRSSIPMHVILGDLVPAAHLWDQVGAIGRHHLGALTEQMGCWSNLWLDTSRGVFCRGPKGPECTKLVWDMEELPLDAELLQEDVMLRHLISRKLDRQAIYTLARSSYGELSQVKVGRPTIISARTNTILAVGNVHWASSGFGERVELPDGTTRLTLLPGIACNLDMYLNGDIWSAWAAQALRVFHAHRVSLEGDLCEYKLIIPWNLKPEGKLLNSRVIQRRRRKYPIYLLIPPFSTSAFWSFDTNGQTPLSNNLCQYLGLPVRLVQEPYELSWETSTYQRLRDHQTARGFDPTATDFAQQNGYPIFDIVNQPLPSRFEELDNTETMEIFPFVTQQDTARAESVTEPTDFSLGILFGDTQPVGYPVPLDLSGISTNNFVVPAQTDSTETKNKVTKSTNIWSSLMSRFSWAAVDNLDIHAAGF